MRALWTILAIAAAGSIIAFPSDGNAAEHMVYSVYRGVDLGNPGEVPLKDFYVNMGSTHGVHQGMVLEVSRKISTYDLLTEKLYKDMVVPIARIKVIHVENNAAVARLEKMLPAEKFPVSGPRAVMVGDFVSPAGE